ncbi:MAG: peptidyl-dipeptidase Dcp [Blastocatellia bacterium]|jgi:peptidyl-dipeptidase Dcp|nr:peptidyl-dipeptidase Dcp [Blastocatellia bacterium]
MRSITRSLLLLFATALIVSAVADHLSTPNGMTTQATNKAEPNPLLASWEGPYGGVPPFDKVQVALFKPALEAAMNENLTDIDKIANDSAAPTFENTIVAMERAGQTLDRVSTLYGVWGSTMAGPEFQAVQREMAPKLAAFSDKITQNEALFKRIEAVYNSPDKKKLNSEQQRLVWLDYTNFVRSGAKLNTADKARLSQINQQLAGLFTKFSQNVLAEEDGQFVALKSEADLAGLPQSVRDAAAAAATTKKQEGWLISNTRSSVDPFLTYSDRRDLREKVWRMFIMRGDNGDEHDNNSTITQILQLRAERAKLLGFPTHAHWRLENSMAKTPERAMELMMAVWKPAVARVHEEVADMQALATKEGSAIKIEPWDYRYYAERVRKAKYDLDQNEVKPYLQLEKLRDGIFWVAGELFNFNFTPATNVPVAHPDIRVWQVTDKTSGKQIGLWYFDPYARAGKRSGAWMNAYRTQERVNGEITTIVSNNANFVKGKPGEPLLISWDDASTMFHEFGHALHGLNSNVTYPSLSGTAVARDYVEFPSQLMEHWLSTPEVLNKFAVHYQTGKPIPQELVDKIKRSATFNEGFITVEYLAAALLDMKLHTAGDRKIDPRAFEKEALAELDMPHEIVLRHRLPQFMHVFSSDSYSAGYYSYLWADVITADAFGAFTEAGGPYDKKVAERLRKNIFSVGNTIDPAEAYRNFRGRDPKVEALMKKRGFPS